MTDYLTSLIDESGFKKYFDDRTLCKEVVLFFHRAWCAFAGSKSRMSPDILRMCVKQFLMVTPEYVRLISTEDTNIANRVIARVAELICQVGHEEAEQTRDLFYKS